MYAAFIGFLITFILGYAISLILKLLHKQGIEKIYLDSSKTMMDPDLFMPPKAMSIRKRNLKYQGKIDKKFESEKY